MFEDQECDLFGPKGRQAGVHVNSRYQSPLAPFLATLNERQVKHLSGNGMNLCTLCAWFLYCSMNVVRKESDKLMEEFKLAQESLVADSQAADDDASASEGDGKGESEGMERAEIEEEHEEEEEEEGLEHAAIEGEHEEEEED